MSDAKNLSDYEAVKTLADRLAATLSYIDRQDTPHDDEPASWTLAQALEHVEESCIEFQKHLAALVASSDDESMETALVELREDLRHILWHIRDTPYFADLTTGPRLSK
ncbi:MAG: hypothetical protein ABR581_02095 [Thermoleophilaceae bacterium]